MKIEIRATYPATDGSMPEDLMVEIETTDTAPTVDLTEFVGAVLDAMVTAPSRAAFARSIQPWRPENLNPGPAEVIGASALMQCRRLMCGHGRMNHGRYDQNRQDVGMGKGECLICGTANRCPSYVGAAPKEET